MSASDDATVADNLADRINRLRLTRHDPESFHAEIDGVARALRQLAVRLRRGPKQREHVWRS